VSDETWKAFRGAALTQGISVAAYLGRLVEAEVGRREKRRIAGVQLGDPPAEQALQALAEVRGSMDELDAIAGRLARTAAFQGASWEDVASLLRLSEDAAREAYGPRG
jgi:hypothetical protein